VDLWNAMSAPVTQDYWFNAKIVIDDAEPVVISVSACAIYVFHGRYNLLLDFRYAVNLHGRYNLSWGAAAPEFVTNSFMNFLANRSACY